MNYSENDTRPGRKLGASRAEPNVIAMMPQAARSPASRPPAKPTRHGRLRRVRHAALRPWRGWLVVAGAFLVTMVGYGAIYSYAAFADEIAAEFGASRAQVSLIFALSGGTALLVSAIGGPLADRIGARPTACLGMTIVALGLLTASGAQSLEEVIAGYGLLIGLGVGFSYVPAVATVQRWFVANRGLASGIALSGIGVGTALVPPFADLLTAFGNWRTAFAICTVLAMLTGLAGAMLLEQSPESVGLAPDGRRRSRQPSPAQATASLHGPPSPLRSIRFGQIYCATMLLSVPVAIPYALVVGTAQEIGHSLADALALIGLIGIGSIGGRFLLAAIGDALGRTRVFLFCCAALAASMLIWAMARTMLEMQIFALAFGAFQGAFVALLPSAVSDRFGGHMLGTVIGVLYTSRAIALFAGPPVVAAAIAFSGSKVLPLVAVAALASIGVALLGRALGAGGTLLFRASTPPPRPAGRAVPQPVPATRSATTPGG